MALQIAKSLVQKEFWAAKTGIPESQRNVAHSAKSG
jgi:hypothetical protein